MVGYNSYELFDDVHVVLKMSKIILYSHREIK